LSTSGKYSGITVNRPGIPEKKMLKVDTHVHTCYSADSALSLENLIKACQNMGVNCIAVTDHDTIKGAVRLQEIAPFRVIVGEEIRTLDGEITGLFLKEEIPPNLSAEETFSRIKAQGGLIYIPHPFSFFRREAIYIEKLHELYGHADIIECYNGRNFLFFENRRAINFTLERKLAMGAGSDAHHQCEIGNVFIEMDDFNTKEEFLAGLKKGRVVVAPYSRRIGSFMIEAFFFLVWVKIFNLFRKEYT